MKKKQLLLSALLVLMGTGAANAQKALQQSSGQAYTYVQQNDVKIDKLGTAAFELSATSHPTVEFDENGKAVMKIGDNTVAALPMSDKGQLVVEFETTVAEADLNKVTKTYSNEYATLYSPFQLVVPEGAVETYAPTYDAQNHVLKCTDATKMAAGEVLPCETALLLKNAGTAVYAISAGASTASPQSALSGSSLQIAKPEVASGETLYTLGHQTEDTSKYGFFQYTGANLNPGLAWLVAETVSEQQARNFVAFNFGEETTAVSELKAESLELREGKFIENGRVVILKNGQKYNINGQSVR